MGSVNLRYGQGTVSITIPDAVNTVFLMPNDLPPVRNFRQEFLHALDDPIASPPLKDLARQNGSRPVVIIVNDPTRLANSERFIHLLLDYLNEAGVPDAQVTVVFACGSHRPLSDCEMDQVIGESSRKRVRCINHVACDQASLVYHGTTTRGTPVWLNRTVSEAGLRILTGSIVHHFMAGFGGGRKALVPGVAGHETIQRNHAMMLCEGAEIGRLDGNPLHLDLLEAARITGGGFLVNMVLNEQHEFAGVFCGDMEKAHVAGCRMVERMNGVSLPWEADLVIASCGGYPKDINMYQAQKTLDNAAQATRPGGHIVFLAECCDGVGSDTYHDWAKRYRTLPALENALRANFVLGGHKAYAVGKLLARATVWLLSSLQPDVARELGFRHVASVQDAISTALAMAGPGARVLVMPEGSITVPRRDS
ncbi:MAG: nickel-dependent lactate racemase [Bacillota bacterium]|nr:nickel-dependent lactate racemase [Bacillota bacterium]